MKITTTFEIDATHTYFVETEVTKEDLALYDKDFIDVIFTPMHAQLLCSAREHFNPNWFQEKVAAELAEALSKSSTVQAEERKL